MNKDWFSGLYLADTRENGHPAIYKVVGVIGDSYVCEHLCEDVDDHGKLTVKSHGAMLSHYKASDIENTQEGLDLFIGIHSDMLMDEYKRCLKAGEDSAA